MDAMRTSTNITGSHLNKQLLSGALERVKSPTWKSEQNSRSKRLACYAPSTVGLLKDSFLAVPVEDVRLQVLKFGWNGHHLEKLDKLVAVVVGRERKIGDSLNLHLAGETRSEERRVGKEGS